MPDIDYSIRIIDDNGKGISGEKVSVHYPFTHENDWTDEDGWVSFSKNNLVDSTIEVSIYFKGDLLGEITAEDGDTFSLTYSY